MNDYNVESALVNIAREFHKCMQTKNDKVSKQKMAELLKDREKVINLDEEIIKKYQ